MSAFKLFNPNESSGEDVPSVPNVVARYLAYLRSRVDAGDFDPDGFADIFRELNLFAAAHDWPVSQCAQRDVAKWLRANPQWKAVSTRKRIMRGIIGCFGWAADEEMGDLIDFCPYRMPQSLRGVASEVRRPADHREYIALMRFGSRPLRRALFFIRRTGCRPKEMRELIWPQVHLDCESPHVRIEKHKTKRKTGKVKKFGLDAGTVRFLRNLKRQAVDEAGLVFTNCDGGPWSRRVFARHLRRCAERIGLDAGVESVVSAYCLRHTWACDGIEGGLTSREVADQLGHTSTDMVDRIYGSHTRQREEHLGNVANKMQRKRRRN